MIAPTDSETEDALRLFGNIMERAQQQERATVLLWLDVVVRYALLRRGDDAGAALVAELAGRIEAGEHLGRR
jgi:hypothetical protein